MIVTILTVTTLLHGAVWAAELAEPSSGQAPLTAVPTNHWLDPEFKACMEKKPKQESDSEGRPAIPNPATMFKKAEAGDLPLSTQEGNLKEYLNGIQKQLALCEKQKATESFVVGPKTFTRQSLCVEANKKVLEIGARASTKTFADLMKALREEFDWYQKSEPDGSASQILFTGYNAPTFEVSAVKTAEYKWPIYKPPPDLAEKKAQGPYYTRAAINDGALDGRGLEIAYAKSPLAVMRLQVEGSGLLRVKQPDGSVKLITAHVETANGYPYTSLGKAMRCLGVASKYLSDKGMETYFAEHPGRLLEMINLTRTYAFFEFDQKLPKGSIGLELTPRHSVAVDNRLIPFGSVGLIAAGRPNDGAGPVQSFSTLVIPQDIGAAIKMNHVDIFWGWDDYAEKAATSMKSPGVYFIGVPKSSQPGL